MNNYIPYIVIFFCFGLASFYFYILKKEREKRLKKSLEIILFLIRFPKNSNSEEEKENLKSFISKMEQFYSNFLYLKKGDSSEIIFEIASQVGGSDISFFIAVPKKIKQTLLKYVQGVFPEAVLEEVPNDYTIFEPNGVERASYLYLKKHFSLPIKTYKNLEADPLEIIANSLTKISADEGSSVQVIIKPLNFDYKNKLEKILSLIKTKGFTYNDALKKVEESIFSSLFNTIFSNSSAKKEDTNLTIKESQDLLNAIEQKISSPAFATNIRLIASAKEIEKAEEVLNGLEGGFSQFFSNYNNFEFKRLKGSALRDFIFEYSFRKFNSKNSIILNVEEISSIYHFPSPKIKTPYINWIKTRDIAPPSNIPESGPICIGETLFRGSQKKVYMHSREDRRRHFYTIGQTGVGKTSLLREMIRQDILNGEGVGVIDPHGDLIEDTLANIPKERIDDVIIFEPSDIKRPCGLNMLEWDIPEQKDFAVNEMISIFMQLFPPEMIGPMFEHYMRNGMLTLMADKNNPGTLVQIPRIFTDPEFASKKLKTVTDPVLRSFWEKEWKQTVGEDKSKMLGYIVSKVGRFIENEMIRNIIGQNKSSFDFSEIMDSKKIFLANLSKGLTGSLNSSLLGLILVSKLEMAAMKRASIPEKERKDFYLYIDEFQNFTTNSIATILSEARKYRLNLILANQFMPQLKEEIRNAVIGNVGTIAVYRIGEDDAKFFENKFQPEFSYLDLSNIDNYNFILKTIVNGSVSSPFKVKALYSEDGDREQIKFIREFSRQRYGNQKEKVEEDIKNKTFL